MTCSWIINLLISAAAADGRLHFWPLENDSSRHSTVIQADRARNWRQETVSSNLMSV